MTLLDGQYRFDAPNGESLLMGAGTPYSVQTVSGLRALGPIAAADTKRTGQHGALRAGRRTYGLRVIQMDIVILSDSDGGDTDVESLLDDFYSVMQVTDLEGSLVMKRRAKPERVIFCSPRVAEFPGNFDSWVGSALGSVQLGALDPLVYSTTVRDATVSANIPGARTYPKVYPVTYPGGVSAADAVVNNEGTIEVPPFVTFTGPITNPGVVNLTTGQTVSMDFTLAAGQVLEVDFNLHNILLNGVSHRAILDELSDWWAVQPGENEISMVGSGAGSAVISFRDAWPAA